MIWKSFLVGSFVLGFSQRNGIANNNYARKHAITPNPLVSPDNDSIQSYSPAYPYLDHLRSSPDALEKTGDPTPRIEHAQTANAAIERMSTFFTKIISVKPDDLEKTIEVSKSQFFESRNTRTAERRAFATLSDKDKLPVANTHGSHLDALPQVKPESYYNRLGDDQHVAFTDLEFDDALKISLNYFLPLLTDKNAKVAMVCQPKQGLKHLAARFIYEMAKDFGIEDRVKLIPATGIEAQSGKEGKQEREAIRSTLQDTSLSVDQKLDRIESSLKPFAKTHFQILRRRLTSNELIKVMEKENDDTSNDNKVAMQQVTDFARQSPEKGLHLDTFATVDTAMTFGKILRSIYPDKTIDFTLHGGYNTRICPSATAKTYCKGKRPN